jgi:hypothetical protein
MSTTFYTGPMVAHLGGADISWVIGLIGVPQPIPSIRNCWRLTQSG